MSAFAPIYLNDGAIPPVTRNFSPVAIDAAGVAKLVDRSGGVALGFPTMTLSVRAPGKGARNYKVVGKITLPTLESSSSVGPGISPAPTKAYDHLGTFEFVLPERGTEEERKNILSLIGNMLTDHHVLNAVQLLEPIY